MSRAEILRGILEGRPVAMLPMGDDDWAMTVPAMVIPELDAVAVDVVWDLKISAN